MSATDWGGVAVGGWLLWAIACAIALRLALGAAGRHVLKFDRSRAGAIAWLGMIAIFVASFWLHGAVLGPGNLYGATPREALSLQAYLLAPFGLPLLVGGFFVLIGDMVAVLTFSKKVRPQ